MDKIVENTPAKLPQDITGCRASDIGIADLGECMRVGPNSCLYALPFGYSFLCQHPRLWEIISNTIKADPVASTINHN